MTTKPHHSILYLQPESIRSILLEKNHRRKGKGKGKVARKEKDMIIKRSSIPVSARGKAGSTSISVRENGQIGFSSKVAQLFNGRNLCVIDWEPKGRTMVFTPTDKAPKGMTQDDLVEIKESKIGKNKKVADRYISLAGLFRLPDINYDFKAAGTHTFPATINSANGNSSVSFQLPKEMARENRPKRTRKAKAAVAGAGVAGSTNASNAPANGADVNLEEAA